MRNVVDIFRLFFFAGWRRQALIMLAMLLGVAAENLSIASLWPIVSVASGVASQWTSRSTTASAAGVARWASSSSSNAVVR